MSDFIRLELCDSHRGKSVQLVLAPDSTAAEIIELCSQVFRKQIVGFLTYAAPLIRIIDTYVNTLIIFDISWTVVMD
jgi:hypothetical protein